MAESTAGDQSALAPVAAVSQTNSNNKKGYGAVQYSIVQKIETYREEGWIS